MRLGQSERNAVEVFLFQKYRGGFQRIPCAFSYRLDFCESKLVDNSLFREERRVIELASETSLKRFGRSQRTFRTHAITIGNTRMRRGYDEHTCMNSCGRCFLNEKLHADGNARTCLTRIRLIRYDTFEHNPRTKMFRKDGITRHDRHIHPRDTTGACKERDGNEHACTQLRALNDAKQKCNDTEKSYKPGKGETHRR